MQNMPRASAASPGRASRGRGPAAGRRSSTSAPAHAATAKTMLTYRHQRQSRYWVSRPPSSSPTAPPAPAMAPKTPNALPRSRVPAKVVVSRESAAGASSAPNAPWQARAAMSTPKLPAAPPAAEGRLAADQVGEPAAEQQQAAECERVAGDDPLPLGVREVQGVLG